MVLIHGGAGYWNVSPETPFFSSPFFFLFLNFFPSCKSYRGANLQANSFQVCVNSLRFAGGMTNSSAQLERKWHKRRLSRQRVLLMTNLMRIFFFFVFLSDEEEKGEGIGRGGFH